MRCRSIKYAPIFGFVGVLAVLLSPSVGRTLTITAGCDFLETVSGTTFNNIPFTGVPLGTVNLATLSCGSGSRNVDGADTVVKRNADATPANPIIPIEMVALQLSSGSNLFITLQKDRGVDFVGDPVGNPTDPAKGPISTGQMIINQNPNTFDSFIDVSFDVRQGGLNGPIIQSGNDRIFGGRDDLLLMDLPTANDPRDDIPWCGSFIPGCGQPFDEQGLLAKHRVKVPAPSALLLLSFGLIILATIGRRRLVNKA